MQESRDALVRFIQKKLGERGIAPAVASKTIGKNHAYLQQFFSRNVPRALPEEPRAKLARLIDVPESDLKVSIDTPEGEPKNNSSHEKDLYHDSQTVIDDTPTVRHRTAEEGARMSDGLSGEVLKSILRRLDRMEDRIDEIAGARGAAADPRKGTKARR